MKHMLTSLTALTLSAQVCTAEQNLNAGAFERYTTGKTLFFSRQGTAYGAERYLPNRRVIWSFLDGQCKDGIWYEDGGNICFEYDGAPDNPQCWSFSQGPSGLIAEFKSGPSDSPLYEAQDTGQEMICLGPDTGV